MIDLKQITISDLQYLVDYFLKNKDSISQIIADFGKVKSDNGYGTLFLDPVNSLFKVFWIFRKQNKIKIIGFGGQQLGLSLMELHSFYTNYNESFSAYDEEYVYVFYDGEDSNYKIKISSPQRLFEDGKIISNIAVNAIEILLN